MGHWKGEGLREQLVREVLEDFSFLNQDIQIEFAFAADVLPEKSPAAAAELIARMVRTGTIEWDVVWLDATIYRRVAKLLDDPGWGAKHLVDFFGNPAVEQAHKPFLFQENTHCRNTGSILTGPYIEGFFYLMIYNPSLAQRLGLEIREEEMTAADLLGYARRLDEYNRTAAEPVDLLALFANSGSLQRLAYNLFLSCPPEELAGNAEPAIARVLQTFEQLGRCESVRGMDVTRDWEAASRMFMADRALFIADATWRCNMLTAAYPDISRKAAPAQMPGFGPQRYCIGGFIPTWAVMKNSPARAAGIRLMEFWSRPEIAEKWERYTKNPSGLRGGVYDPEYRQDALAIYQRRLSRGRTFRPDLFLEQDEVPPPIMAYSAFLLPLLRQETTAAEAMQTVARTKPR